MVIVFRLIFFGMYPLNKLFKILNICLSYDCRAFLLNKYFKLKIYLCFISIKYIQKYSMSSSFYVGTCYRKEHVLVGASR